VVGCISYRGYFDRTQAEAYAETLRAQGLEVAVYGVPAYSTLRWGNWLGGDPLLNTFALGPAPEFTRYLFHELAHQVAYAPGDTSFNESYATAVERIGWARCCLGAGPLTGLSEAGQAEASRAADERRHQWRALTAAARERLDRLFGSGQSDEAKREGKAAIYAEMRADYETLKRTRWGGDGRYDVWMARAHNGWLAIQGAYDDQVDAFMALYRQEGEDMARFHAAVRRLADLPEAQRHATLRELKPRPLHIDSEGH
jgi:predicted aminopeptidase